MDGTPAEVAGANRKAAQEGGRREPRRSEQGPIPRCGRIRRNNPTFDGKLAELLADAQQEIWHDAAGSAPISHPEVADDLRGPPHADLNMSARVKTSAVVK